jgi:hypothetical protein
MATPTRHPLAIGLYPTVLGANPPPPVWTPLPPAQPLSAEQAAVFTALQEIIVANLSGLGINGDPTQLQTPGYQYVSNTYFDPPLPGKSVLEFNVKLKISAFPFSIPFANTLTAAVTQTLAVSALVAGATTQFTFITSGYIFELELTVTKFL